MPLAPLHSRPSMFGHRILGVPHVLGHTRDNQREGTWRGLTDRQL